MTVYLKTGRAAVDKTKRMLVAMINSKSDIPLSIFLRRTLVAENILLSPQISIWFGTSIPDALLMKCERLISRSRMQRLGQFDGGCVKSAVTTQREKHEHIYSTRARAK